MIRVHNFFNSIDNTKIINSSVKMLSLSLAVNMSGICKDLGVSGNVFSIQELDLLETIHIQLKNLEDSGEIDKHHRHIKERVMKSIERPSPVNLPEAQSYQSHLYDPAIVVGDDIVDHKGNMIAAKGTRVNPLETHSFGAPFVFIDGDNNTQVQWALSQTAQVILVKGAPLKLSKHYQLPVYFDQGGALTRRFDITAIPAKVSQQDMYLLVEQFKLKENMNDR